MSSTPLRPTVNDEQAALKEINKDRAKPSWIQGQRALPFGFLSPDEFEVFCYLLVRREPQSSCIGAYYYGKTGDSGRDIICVRTGNHLVLIQCKHYQTNIGLPVVRTELAKLFVNVHKQKIKAPDSIAFYVSTDMTAPARDYLTTPAEWRKEAETALKDFLGEAPSADLLGFAKTWWPGFEIQSGLDLTERARRIPGLVDDFFEIQKVITGDISAVSSELSDLRQLLLRALPDPDDVADSFKKLLGELETANPGLTFKAEATPNGIIYQVRAKKAGHPVLVGTLSFPQTEAGRLGLEKYQRAIELGDEVSLEPNEHYWESNIKGNQLQIPAERRALTFTPPGPSRKVPVRLDSFEGKVGGPGISFTYLRALRRGTKEIELELAGGGLAADLKLVLRHDGKPNDINFLLDLRRIPPAKALETISFLSALKKGVTVRIVSLEHGLPLIEVDIDSNSLNATRFEGAKQLLGWLATINHHCGTDIRYPLNPITHEEAEAVELIASVINHRVVSPSRPPAECSMELSREQAEALLNDWQSGRRPSCTAEWVMPQKVLGHEVNLPDAVMEFQEIHPTESVQELSEKVKAFAPESLVPISFRPSRIVYALRDK